MVGCGRIIQIRVLSIKSQMLLQLCSCGLIMHSDAQEHCMKMHLSTENRRTTVVQPFLTRWRTWCGYYLLCTCPAVQT